MYRDFSDSSRQRLLGLVSEVENEKWSDFTDWIGDCWYDFETWIGRLDIGNYIDLLAEVINLSNGVVNMENDGLTLSSLLLGNLGKLCGAIGLRDKSGLDTTSSFLSLLQSSAGVELGIYGYYGKKLNPYGFSRIDGRYGKTMTEVSIISGLAGTADDGIDTYEMFIDSNSTIMSLRTVCEE